MLFALLSEPLLADLEEVVVFAARDASGQHALLKTPGIVRVTDHAAAGITIADLISDLPAVSLNGQGGSLQAYSVRGFSRARIQTRMFGVPLATERRAGNSATFIDPFLVGDVQVVKGAGALLFGSGAMGGVVATAPRRFTTPMLTVSGYSNGEQRMLGAGTGNETLSFGVAYREHGQSEDAEGRDLNDAMKRGSASLLWETDLTDTLFVKLSAAAGQGRDIGKSSSDYPLARVTDYPEETHYLTHLSLQRNDRWNLEVYLHDQSLDTFVTEPGRAAVLTASSSMDFGASFIHRWQRGSSIYRAGIERQQRSDVVIDESVFLLMPQTIANLDGSQREDAIFADGQWQQGKWLIQAGARYSHAVQRGDGDRQSDASWTGALAARYDINSNTGVYVEFGSAFRFPQLTEKFFSGVTGRGLVIGNPALDAESSRSLEIGFNTEADSYSFNVAVFRSDIDDYIERVEVADRILTFRNLHEGTIQGVEFSASRLLPGNFRLDTSGHWMQGEDENGMTLSDMSPAEVSVSLGRSHTWGNCQIDYDYRLSSDDASTEEMPLDAYRRLSAMINVDLSERTSLRLWADNLLDEDFYTTADELAPLGTGRGVGATLRFTPTSHQHYTSNQTD